MDDIEKKYDVVILGGGTSGCSCAYNCAKNKLKTLLIEKNNFLGGLMTGGLVVPIMKSSVRNFNCSYYKTLITTAKKFNAQITYKDKNDGWLNPELLKIVLEDILSKPKIKKYLDILFESEVKNVFKKNDLIDGIEISNGFLSLPIVAKYFVDATGSAEFSKITGCNFLNDNETKQQNSLRFVLGNVDLKKFEDFLISLEDDEDITNTYRIDSYDKKESFIHFTTASTWDNSKIWKLDKYLKQAVLDKVLKPCDRAYFQIFTIAGGANQVAFNCPRFKNFSENVFKYSDSLIDAKKAIFRLYQFCKKYLAGFENSTITNIADITGIRESKRVKTKYIYTIDDIINSKRFENPVLEANYPIDIHSDKKNASTLKKYSKYQLPIESLISADLENLFVIGKILGADFKAQSALRVQKSCMSMGEAVAKYIAKKLIN